MRDFTFAMSREEPQGRILVVDRRLVIYRPRGNIVFVVRVLEGRRDLTKLVDPAAS